MVKESDLLSRLRVASPCNVGWERMAGDERLRFCEQCNLHVYNISAMTGEEVASLIKSKEGRICGRLYRRADGTVLTRDCPVGLRAVRRRISKTAGAALTAILSLWSGAAAQTKPQEDKSRSRVDALKIKRTTEKDERATFSGVVTDAIGAVIPGARITLVNEKTGEQLTALSTDDGEFKFSNLAAGNYTFKIEVAGFKTYQQEHIVLKSHEAARVDLTLQVSEPTHSVLVGVISEMPQPESGGRATIISEEMIRKLPLP